MVDTRSRSIFRVVLSVLLLLSVAATLFAYMVGYSLFDATCYMQVAESPAFTESVHTAVYDQLESECLFYELPFDTMKSAIDKEQINHIAKEQLVSVGNAIVEGKPVQDVTLDMVPFVKAIDTFFASLPEDERPLDDNAVQTIANDLVKAIEPVLHLGIGNTLLKSAQGIMRKLLPLKKFTSLSVWFLVASLVLAVSVWFLAVGPFSHRLYTVAGLLFLGSSVAAVPMWLFRWYDLPSRLVLGQSALKQYINQVIYSLVDHLTIVTSTVVAVSAVLLITAVVLKLKSTKE
ncbi:MAG: hypothetical protein J6Q42_06435 [Clostridia bacterium]|jgi:hypothetical protein|nr:hypothetical protein [Clostridia bacterium]